MLDVAAIRTEIEPPSGRLLAGAAWGGALFDGAWRAGAGEISVIEKATGATLGSVGLADPALTREVIDKAQAAQRAWAGVPAEARAALIRKAAGLLEANADEILEWIVRESGGLRPKAEFELHSAVAELHHAAAQLIQPHGHILASPDPSRTSLAQRLPLGVVGVITPWNFPLLLAMRSAAPALALGNAVVLKPDPQTPICGGVVLARIFEEAGLPAGVFGLVNGGADVGEALIEHPAVRMITFTGSTAVGRRVGELAGRHLKKVALELGGNNAFIVLDDADLAAAASAGAWGSFLHQGQICMATGRHIVHRKIAQAYTEALAQKAAHLPVGDPFRQQVALGPIINERQLANVHAIVSQSVEQGAQLAAGGTYEGLFYRPTVLAGVTADMPAFSREIFGPVAPVIIAEDDDHAVALANQTEYGLSGAIQTGRLDRGLSLARQIHAGMVHVNDQTVGDMPQIPMGGMGSSGNGNRFGSITAWEEFTEWQWLTFSSTPARYPF
ncbi:benzaldehyde dehydrogenase [Caulobacter segnis]|uniref:Benzaldehyde dehydrogenase (NAD(+)) n=2 Tax=Caulobacter segnis TaxID=88688 RepID=D5VG99_CAUST|nr:MULTISPECIES: aldehyde dehydrogenase family protein [Caulobacter]ADG10218.1 Benzaldehyde dehydrogenase (NAD(+)) [Caulobacter segnis ATCC 21756]AVQ01961.1 benzaldehyde dehydrogenase [Caulobacter segnis]SFJ32179.1 benzaldehyde dehydrogenase (NAD) [Caulobacter sp. UNC279MFTsu5.1]